MLRLLDGLLGLLLPENAVPVDLPAGVSLRRSRFITAAGGMLAGMRGPAAAVTLGRTIIVSPTTIITPRLIRHELAHVRQWTRRPLVFPLAYAAFHLRSGYNANPYELEAQAAERGEEAGPAAGGRMHTNTEDERLP